MAWPLTVKRSTEPAWPLTRTLIDCVGMVSPFFRSMKPGWLSIVRITVSRSTTSGADCGSSGSAAGSNDLPCVGSGLPAPEKVEASLPTMPCACVPDARAVNGAKRFEVAGLRAELTLSGAVELLPLGGVAPAPRGAPIKVLAPVLPTGNWISAALLGTLAPVAPPADTWPVAGSPRRSPVTIGRPCASSRWVTNVPSRSPRLAASARREVTSAIMARLSQLLMMKLALWNSPFFKSTNRLWGSLALRLSSRPKTAPAGSVLWSSRITWVMGLMPYRLHLPSLSVITLVPSSMNRRTPGIPASSAPSCMPLLLQSR